MQTASSFTFFLSLNLISVAVMSCGRFQPSSQLNEVATSASLNVAMPIVTTLVAILVIIVVNFYRVDSKYRV